MRTQLAPAPMQAPAGPHIEQAGPSARSLDEAHFFSFCAFFAFFGASLAVASFSAGAPAASGTFASDRESGVNDIIAIFSAIDTCLVKIVDGHATELVELTVMGVIVEGAGDQPVEARLARGGDEVGARDRVELRADEYAGAHLLCALGALFVSFVFFLFFNTRASCKIHRTRRIFPVFAGAE